MKGTEGMLDSLQDKSYKRRKFDEALIEAIDEALSPLGDNIKNTVYFKLEDSFKIPKDEIPTHIDGFADFLIKIFGLGASILEINCMRNLHSRINVNIQVTEEEGSVSKWITEGMTFEDYVCSVRNNYCNPV